MRIPPLKKEKLDLRLVDAAVLLVNLYNASKQSEIGFLDADQTLDMLVHKIDRKVTLSKVTVESALCHSNMLNELGKFWHYEDLTLEEFINKIITKDRKFNSDYNYMYKPKDKEE